MKYDKRFVPGVLLITTILACAIAIFISKDVLIHFDDGEIREAFYGGIGVIYLMIFCYVMGKLDGKYKSDR